MKTSSAGTIETEKLSFYAPEKIVISMLSYVDNKHVSAILIMADVIS